MIVDKVEIVSQPVYFLVTQPVRFPLIRSPDPIDVQYQRSESDGEISITGGSHRSDGKMFTVGEMLVNWGNIILLCTDYNSYL